MGYVQRTSGPVNFSKAVISAWFIVPQASIDAATADYVASGVDEGESADLNMRGFVPLITFGPNGDVEIDDVGTGKTSPCMIGINVRDYYQEYIDAPALYVRLQYTTGLPADIASGVIMDQPDCFVVGGRADMNVSVIPLAESIAVAPDVWHHVLVSFDLSGGSNTTFPGGVITQGSACSFWWAFDDVNYSGAYLWPGNLNAHTGGVAGANDIVSMWCTIPNTETSRSFAAGDLETADNEIGIPSSSNQETRIRNVVLQDVQIFTDVTLDTSVELNRRAFVTSEGIPAAPALAISLLGKSPDVAMIGNWLNGENQGTIGSFTKTGTTLTYTPTADI